MRAIKIKNANDIYDIKKYNMDSEIANIQVSYSFPSFKGQRYGGLIDVSFYPLIKNKKHYKAVNDYFIKHNFLYENQEYRGIKLMFTNKTLNKLESANIDDNCFMGIITLEELNDKIKSLKKDIAIKIRKSFKHPHELDYYYSKINVTLSNCLQINNEED